MGGRSTPTPSSYPLLATKPVGKQIQNIYTDRLGQFQSGGQYQGQNLLSKLYNKVEDDEKYIKVQQLPCPQIHYG